MDPGDKPFRPYWLDRALNREGNPEAGPLLSDIQADVCIVGGGYTGLWTGIFLKEKHPDLNIVIVEQECCGYGASGCNGGCMLTLSTKFPTLAKLYGENEAKKIVKASENAVFSINDFTVKHDIQCELRLDGALYIATNSAQKNAIRPVMETLEEAGINSWKKTERDTAVKFSGTRLVEEAYFSPYAGSVQPAMLVRGMAAAAKKMGIQIFEKTPMLELRHTSAPEVITPKGRITARKVVLAVNAWIASHFKQFARSIIVVSSDMIITEPCPDLLKKTGLAHGASICDSRIFVHYYHTTEDGRLMMGKGGNTFAFNSKMIKSFFEPSRYAGQLQQAAARFFPELSDVRIESSWNGGSDRSVTGFPFFGSLDGHPSIFYGFGYSGNGVVQSYIGGKILCSLVLGQNDNWSGCGFVGTPEKKFPPEPFKWLGSLAVRNAVRRKEAFEEQEKLPLRRDRFLSGYARMAGKADS